MFDYINNLVVDNLVAVEEIRPHGRKTKLSSLCESSEKGF